MNVLLTAAGAGSRFRDAGVAVPKPLIRVQGRELLLHTLASFAFAPGDRLLLAVQRAHGVRERLGPTLQRTYPALKLDWLELDQLLPGQLATAVAAVERCWADQPALLAAPLLIHNCDTGFRWPAQAASGRQLQAEGAYGSMAVFEAEGEHWSFGRPDPADPLLALEIAEKRRISNLASIGLYGFRSTARFLADGRHWLEHGTPMNGEHYVAPLLNGALQRGERVLLPRINGVRLYGTPPELQTTFAISAEQLLAENRPR